MNRVMMQGFSTPRVAALTAALAISAVSASAGAVCWNNNCNDRSASSAGCRDGTQFVAATASIKGSTGSVIGHVNLMYSTTCGAAWAYTASAVGKVSEVDAFMFRSDGNLVADSCSDCTTKTSLMLGDAGNLQCRAQGVLREKILGVWIIKSATTSWF